LVPSSISLLDIDHAARCSKLQVVIGSQTVSFARRTPIQQRETMDYQQTALLLQQIESEMKALQWWSHQVPSAKALASTAPFACDQMTLAQWLQFIFLPRMQALVDDRLPLPRNCHIQPMAEMAWAPLSAAQRPLLDALKTLDALLSDAIPAAAGRH